jgi:phosphoribosylglycinamide formyltransferase 1
MRLGVLISGRGSNLQALIEACTGPTYPATIALVISDQAEAAGLARASAARIRAITLPHRSRGEFAAAADAELRAAKIDLVCLAGFMRLLDTSFVDSWRDRMINIHPSLLPAFPGLHAQRQALAAGVRFAGCTIHFVRPEVDTGPIIAQAVVPVHPDDDEPRLSARILAVEHRLYPFAVRLIAEGRARIVDDARVEIRGCEALEFAALNPSPSAADPLVSVGS